jgi:signal transduction histidine kinase/ActR/RegA family two-component response regulator
MKLDAFAAHLRASKESVMQRWLAAVRGDPAHIPSATSLPEPQLRDHIPDLLDELVKAVADGSTRGVEGEAREHGRQRWGDGFDISELLREHTLLRELLMEVVDAYAHETPGLSSGEAIEARRCLRSVLDRSVQGAVAQFHREAMLEQHRLQQELKTANEEKDRFLAMLAHELRNPLAPILTTVQTLQRLGTSDPRLERAHQTIERQARHQARLIDDLLDASRITHGKIELRLDTLDVVTVVQHAVDACLPAIKAGGKELHIELPEAPLPVRADLMRLEQVVGNLLSNAERYTDPGGELWIAATREGNEAVIRVQDTGIGISAEMLPRIFDLFAQADTSLHRARGGLGIGLAVVKSLVERHQGTVEAHSAGPGSGSEFVVRLPIAEALPEAPAADEPGTPRRSLRVALLEDNADARASLAELLELCGYEVITAANGPVALRLIQQAHPDVCLVDIGLPGMDGYEVALQMRRLPTGKDLFLVALTGYGSPEEKERATASGFDAHLTKPADIAELDRLLTQRVGRPQQDEKPARHHAP